MTPGARRDDLCGVLLDPKRDDLLIRAAEASGSTVDSVLERVEGGAVARATRRGVRVALLVGSTRGTDVEGYFALEARRVAAACEVPLLDVGSARDVRWIVRPWIEGRPWTRAARPIVDAMSFLDPLARVLAAAHRAGFGHGALSPTRIVETPRAQIVDLVFAFFLPLTVDPRYAAPEWLERHANLADAERVLRADVYALGLLVLEAVSGRSAYGDIADVDLFSRAVDRTRRPTLGALGVAVAPSIERVLARALAVDPEARFESAGELFTALRAAVADSPTMIVDGPRPRVTSSPPPPLAPRPRAPAAMVAAATTALVLGALGVEALVSAAFGPRSPTTVAATSASASVSTAHLVPPPIASSAASPPLPPPKDMVAVPTASPDFFVDRTEVTVAAYRACVDASVCAPTWKRGSAYDENDPVRREWRCNLHRTGRDDHPVNCVTFVQANAYCAWAGKRLPTGDEWKRAARSDGPHKYPWGDATPRCKEVVFARYGPANPGCDKQPVGTMPADAHPKTASPFGALDMAGSLWEWTTEKSPRGLPYLRGGAWDSPESGVTVESKLEQSPGNGDVTLGFRCVKDAS